ncbi:MAG TPA: phenylalanine--tRNA ligase subunit alpha [Chitinophagaceae bacterium]|nr:phenylalanine--tRNA ligase subunit alpha [Chitinophagaceae bacterium]
MEHLLQQSKSLIKESKDFKINNLDDLEHFRIHFLGSKGKLKQLFALMKDIPNEQKREAGQILNKTKVDIETYFQEVQEQLSAENTKSTSYDVSLPGTGIEIGVRHPLKTIEEKIVSIFEHIGFKVAEGPEVEDDWHNFTSLNMPLNHTARDMQDTFYIQQNPDWLLRTHTSSVQARTLSKGELPIRIVCPGRVYRNETISARAHCFFHQIEGLYVDKNVSFAQLKQTLFYFVQELFGDEVNVRFRPSYFPFTEPSAEMDISCTVCNGKGCNLCKHTGWVEILGCGMVHPNMLKNFDINPEEYNGFAFGLGIERITQIKYRINDLRLYSQNDIRFLKQFKVSN